MNEKLIRRVVTGGVIAGALIILGGLGFALWQSFSDGPRPDVSDLEPKRVAIPDVQNGFLVLIGIRSLVQDVNSYPVESWVRQREKWDQTKVDALLAKNQPGLALLEKSLAKPGFQWEKIDPPYQDETCPPLYRLATLKALSAMNRWKHGEKTQAIEEDLQVFEVGKRLETGGGRLYHFLTGINIENLALSSICWFTHEATADQRTEMESISARLDVDHTATLCDTMRSDFAFQAETTTKIASGKMTFRDIYGGKPLPRFQKEILVQPHTTITMFAEAARQVIHDAPLTYDKIEKEPGAIKKFRRMSSEYEVFLSPNAGGRYLFSDDYGYDLYPSWVSKKYLVIAEVEMTRVLIAIRLYWLDHGKLPATLNDLAPGYLKSVPLDPYDGKPLRYSPTNKIIYSVGRDLMDKGGDFSFGNSDRDHQPTVKIEW